MQCEQAWDHADFVRMLDQSVAHPSSWMPMVVMQEAQVRAFAYRATKVVHRTPVPAIGMERRGGVKDVSVDALLRSGISQLSPCSELYI